MVILIVGKAIASSIISIGVGSVATNIVKTVMPVATKPLMKAAMWVGTAAMASVAAKSAGDIFDKKVDAVLGIKEMVKKEIQKINSKVEEKKSKKLKPENVVIEVGNDNQVCSNEVKEN